MKHKIELLAPGGDIDSIKAAIIAGADAVYCGLDKFNARNRATNITFDQLHGILRLAHENGCEVFITLNIIIVEVEIPALLLLLNRLAHTAIDGIIVQDFGLLHLLATYFPSIKVHASTQLTTHNEGQIKFLNQLRVTRVNLCRELNLDEVGYLTSVAHSQGMLTEVFVHGANCVSFSGLCYMSSVHGGNSGNRGRCSQSCRSQFDPTAMGKSYPLNLKDNSAFQNLSALASVGVDSLKIEGRIKKFDYVYTVVNSWRKHIDRLGVSSGINHDTQVNESVLKKVFNRDLSNGFLMGEVGKELFIDNPRDNSAKSLAKTTGRLTPAGVSEARAEINGLRAHLMAEVEEKISQLSIDKIPLVLHFSGGLGEPLKVVVESPDMQAEFTSKTELRQVKAKGLEVDSLFAKFKAINETGFFIKNLNLVELGADLTVPFSELVVMRQQILLQLNGERSCFLPIELTRLDSHNTAKPSTLSIFISSVDELYLCAETTNTIYFILPDSIGDRFNEFMNLFRENTQLIPCFPSVLIGDDYTAAFKLLDEINCPLLLTNNTGIAFEAWKRGINWVAGPEFNLVNSYSLLCLKEHFNCVGAFLSNELSRKQLKQIKKPANFEFFYSISHPIVLMTSRACLFHQVSGCHKDRMDQHCIGDCQRTDFIRNEKNGLLIIEKTRGNHNRVYNAEHFLNTDIVNDIPNKFDSLFINLQKVDSGTNVETDKTSLIRIFEKLVNGDPESVIELQKVLSPTTNKQYQKGI